MRSNKLTRTREEEDLRHYAGFRDATHSNTESFREAIWKAKRLHKLIGKRRKRSERSSLKSSYLDREGKKEKDRY